MSFLCAVGKQKALLAIARSRDPGVHLNSITLDTNRVRRCTAIDVEKILATGHVQRSALGARINLAVTLRDNAQPFRMGLSCGLPLSSR